MLTDDAKAKERIGPSPSKRAFSWLSSCIKASKAVATLLESGRWKLCASMVAKLECHLINTQGPVTDPLTEEL